jgi:hypothetical protein
MVMSPPFAGTTSAVPPANTKVTKNTKLTKKTKGKMAEIFDIGIFIVL